MEDKAVREKRRRGKQPDSPSSKELPNYGRIYRIVGTSAEEAIHHFLFGQRHILATTDMAIERGAFDVVEKVIARHFKKQDDGTWLCETRMPSLMRYLDGEFTGGVVPREYVSHQQGLFRNLLFFMVVMELLAMEADGLLPGEQQVLEPPVKKPTSDTEKLRRGFCLPFIESSFLDTPVVFCVGCHLSIDRDLVMARIKADQLSCPHCKKTMEDIEEGGDSFAQTEDDEL